MIEFYKGLIPRLFIELNKAKSDAEYWERKFNMSKPIEYESSEQL